MVSNDEVAWVEIGIVALKSDDFVATEKVTVLEVEIDVGFVFVDGVSIVDSLVDGFETVGDCVEDSGVESKDCGVMVLVEYCVLDAVDTFKVNGSEEDDDK